LAPAGAALPQCAAAACAGCAFQARPARPVRLARRAWLVWPARPGLWRPQNAQVSAVLDRLAGGRSCRRTAFQDDDVGACSAVLVRLPRILDKRGPSRYNLAVQGRAGAHNDDGQWLPPPAMLKAVSSGTFQGRGQQEEPDAGGAQRECAGTTGRRRQAASAAGDTHSGCAEYSFRAERGGMHSLWPPEALDMTTAEITTADITTADMTTIDLRDKC